MYPSSVIPWHYGHGLGTQYTEVREYEYSVYFNLFSYFFLFLIISLSLSYNIF